MHKLFRDEKTSNIHAVGAICVLFIAACILFRIFVSDSINTNTNEMAYDMLKLHGTVFMENVDRDVKNLLRTALETPSDVLLDKQTSAPILTQIQSYGVFSNLAIADATGKICVNTVEDSDLLSVSNEVFFQEVMLGNTFIDSKLSTLTVKTKGLLVAVPILSDEKTVGVMFGYILQDILNGYIDDNETSDGCFIMVIDENLDNVASSSKRDRIMTEMSLKGYLKQAHLFGTTSDQVFEEIKEGISGNFEFRYNNLKRKTCLFKSLGYQNWVICYVLPSTGADKYRSFASLEVVVFQIVLFLIFGATLYTVIKLLEKNKKLTEINNKYAMISKESMVVNFTYSRMTGRVEFTGAVEQTLGPIIAGLGSVDIGSILERLHPDDKSLSRNISKALKEGNRRYTTEFRMQNEDGTYSWYRLNGVSVLNEEGEVEKFVGNIQNSDEQIAQEHVLKNKAETDLLTGLINKVTLQDTVDRAIEKNPDGSYAFFIIDLDNFKGVNDNLGHATGDEVLCQVAASLKLVFTEYDYIGRIGGDEFAVMLNIPKGMNSNAQSLIKSKAKALNENLRHTYSNGDISVQVTASIGIAIYGVSGKNYQELYKAADQALYLSKNSGKDQFNIHV